MTDTAQFIIEIPEDKAERLLAQMRLDRNFSECKIIPLSKGHGKIVDANRVLENGDNWEVETALMQTEAIIEADKKASLIDSLHTFVQKAGSGETENRSPIRDDPTK